MSKELEERIKQKKKLIADFIKLSQALGMGQREREKRLDTMLSDLSKLMKQRD